MRKRENAATWEHSQQLNRPSSTSARSNTSRSTRESQPAIASRPAARSARAEQSFMAGTTKKKWSRNVTTDSTHPPEGLFTKDPETIARSLASKKVSPKGPGSGMRMLNFFINRAGKNLSTSEKSKLHRTKELLSERVKGAARAGKRQQKVA